MELRWKLVETIPVEAGRMAEPLTDNDVTWARMDGPGQPMVVTIVLLLDQPLNAERLRETLRLRLLPLARFRQRVAWSAGRYRWLEDAPLDWTVHLHSMQLPEPADQRLLEEQIGRWAGEPLDFTRPLWRCFLVENYAAGCALVFRVHHCIADGVALLRVFLALTDRAAVAQVVDPQAERQEQARLAAKTAKPLTPLRDLTEKMRWGAAFGTALLRQLFMMPEVRTALRGRLNGHKRVAWSAPIPLQDIALIRQRLGGRVNDVMLAVIAGAFGRYLRARGEITPTLKVRLVVPVNLRAYEEEIRLGNQFAVIFTSLPLGMVNPVTRLKAVRAQMERIRILPEAVANRVMINLVGRLPAWLERGALWLFGIKATAVITNVPGPEQPLYLSGAPLGRVLAWVPQISGIGIGVSVLSYAGSITVGVMTDSGVIADPWELVAGFEAELAEWVELAQIEPGWHGERCR
ncbi:MAG: wax ester/triacylglycerol synthase family O-acyltransferase [Candidatus Competibacteraceae bacterium]|nr:wax ester/triacylglycerol synthase family O-acyltransferase [Candidatus Competibacteraceae bacterium]